MPDAAADVNRLPAGLVHRWRTVDGWPMHYVAPAAGDDAGTGRPVVLVHGAGLSFRYLMPYAAKLAARYRVFAPDLPGFGLSHKPDRILSLERLADWLAKWMRTVGLRPAAVFGQSIGCQIVIDLAVRHPDVVDRAVLQAPTFEPAASNWPQSLYRWASNRLGETKSNPPQESADYRECGLKRMVVTINDAIRHDHPERKLPRVACPTLVVRGGMDPLVPQRWAEAATRLLPRGELVVLPGVPHTANSEAPLELMRVTTPFYDRDFALADHPI